MIYALRLTGIIVGFHPEEIYDMISCTMEIPLALPLTNGVGGLFLKKPMNDEWIAGDQSVGGSSSFQLA